MYKCNIFSKARKDIEDAALWYSEVKSGLGLKFTSKVREKIDFIKRNPHASPIKYDKVRIARTNIFPFLIHYIIDEKCNAVNIVAVLHTSRRFDF